ncbi:Dihydrodiol dehydrogenase 3, partial [Bienertia sinuspersici]
GSPTPPPSDSAGRPSLASAPATSAPLQRSVLEWTSARALVNRTKKEMYVLSKDTNVKPFEVELSEKSASLGLIKRVTIEAPERVGFLLPFLGVFGDLERERKKQESETEMKERRLDNGPGYGLSRERNREMEKTSKELLQLEHKDLSSSFNESALLVCGKNKKSLEEGTKLEGKPFNAPLPKSQVEDPPQVLVRLEIFLGVISEANKTLELKAKENPEAFDIEALNGTESNCIEMDLMLGVADLHTQEAMEAAEAAVAGNQRIVDLPHSRESESSSDDDEDDSNDDEEEKAGSSTGKSEKMQVDDSLPQQSERRTKSKRPKIIELP